MVKKVVLLANKTRIVETIVGWLLCLIFVKGYDACLEKIFPILYIPFMIFVDTFIAIFGPFSLFFFHRQIACISTR